MASCLRGQALSWTTGEGAQQLIYLGNIPYSISEATLRPAEGVAGFAEQQDEQRVAKSSELINIAALGLGGEHFCML